MMGTARRRSVPPVRIAPPPTLECAPQGGDNTHNTRGRAREPLRDAQETLASPLQLVPWSQGQLRSHRSPRK